MCKDFNCIACGTLQYIQGMITYVYAIAYT